MPDFFYAKGRILESIQYISDELKEFERDYDGKTWPEYQNDRKIQKLMDRTVENILTALIEVSGTLATRNTIKVENYADALRKASELLGFNQERPGKTGQIGRSEEPPGPPLSQFPLAGYSRIQRGKAVDQGVSQTSPGIGKGTPGSKRSIEPTRVADIISRLSRSISLLAAVTFPAFPALTLFYAVGQEAYGYW